MLAGAAFRLTDAEVIREFIGRLQRSPNEANGKINYQVGEA
jgi:hypothetical protein